MGLHLGGTRRKLLCGVIKGLSTYFPSHPQVDRTRFYSDCACTSLRLFHRNRQSSLSPLSPFLPLPKYFDSQWSYAQYRIPAQAAHISLTSTSSVRSPGTDLAADEKCVVGWITVPTSTQESIHEYQLVALTYSGGWYRLSLPHKGPYAQPSNQIIESPKATSVVRQRTPSISSITSVSDKGKGKERERERKDGRDLVLVEYRKYGRWDGWG